MDKEKLKLIYKLIAEIGDNPKRKALQKTPERFLKAFYEITKGYKQDLNKIINKAIFKYNNKNNNIIIVDNIEFYSLCEHHLLPFFGKCHIAYIPDKKIIGLSKIPRIVDFYAKRLQNQENLTDAIANSILNITKAKGVAVFIEAIHLCMTMRGVEKKKAKMKTIKFLKIFSRNSNLQQNFLNIINKNNNNLL